MASGRRGPRSYVARVVSVCLLIAALAGATAQAFVPFDVLNSVAPVVTVAASITAVASWSWRCRGAAWMALFAAIIAAMPVVHEMARPIAGASADDKTAAVTIVTHNVRFDNGEVRGTAKILQAADPDVILLQETDRVDWGARFDSARYPYRSACGTTGCSLLIVSRWPIVASRYRIRDAVTGDQIGPRLVWATIAPPGRPRFDVATLHLDWPGPAQARQRRDLARSIGALDTGRLILAGDFNLTPWAWAMRDTDADLASLTRVTRATWSYPARIGAGTPLPLPLLPIDHMFVGPGWAVGTVDRLPRTGSDHYPVRVRLIPRPL